MLKNLFLSLITVCVSITAQARDTISVIWPFGVGDTAAQYSRSLIEVLNQTQSQYGFIFENKPGAGSSIAANYVARTPGTLLSASTAFFVRPNFYPAESHSVSQFVPIITQCGAPMLIVSGKFRSWKEVPKDKPVTIAISGIGTTTNLVATEIQKQFPELIMVPYKGIQEATANLISGDIDLQVSFVGEVQDFLQLKRLYALGVTGPDVIDGIPTLASQGFVGMDRVVNMHSILAPANWSKETVNDLQLMFMKASQDPRVLKSYRTDRCKPSTLDSAGNQKWFVNQQSLWKELSDRAKVHR